MHQVAAFGGCCICSAQWLSINLSAVLQGVLRKTRLAKDTSQRFTILESMSTVLQPGRFTLLLGPPGAGKSTLLNALSDRLHKTSNVDVSFCCASSGHVCALCSNHSSRHVDQCDCCLFVSVQVRTWSANAPFITPCCTTSSKLAEGSGYTNALAGKLFRRGHKYSLYRGCSTHSHCAEADSLDHTAWRYMFSCIPQWTVIDSQKGSLSHQHVRYWQCKNTGRHTPFAS